MGVFLGAGRYAINTPLTIVGAISMYLHGGFWYSVYQALPSLFSEGFINATFTYFMAEALPPTSIEQVITQIAIGTAMATLAWMAGMMKVM